MRNSEPNGQGVQLSADGLVEYEGEWKHGKYDGEGRLYRVVCSNSRERVNIHD